MECVWGRLGMVCLGFGEVVERGGETWMWIDWGGPWKGCVMNISNLRGV